MTDLYAIRNLLVLPEEVQLVPKPDCVSESPGEPVYHTYLGGCDPVGLGEGARISIFASSPCELEAAY